MILGLWTPLEFVGLITGLISLLIAFFVARGRVLEEKKVPALAATMWASLFAAVVAHIFMGTDGLGTSLGYFLGAMMMFWVPALIGRWRGTSLRSRQRIETGAKDG